MPRLWAKKDSTEQFLRRFEAAAGGAAVELLAAGGEYDRFEVRRRNGRIDTVDQLASASARIRLTLPVPLGTLGEGERLHFGGGPDATTPGLWLCRDARGTAESIDVIRTCFGEGPSPSSTGRHSAAALVLDELAFHRFTRDPAWRDMGKRFHLRHTPYADRGGLWCEVLITMEACG